MKTKSKTMQFLTIGDFDKMSKSEVQDHRDDILGNCDFKDKDNRQYIDEVNLYIHVRFKQDVYDGYERWVKRYQADPTNNRDLKLIVGILTEPERDGADTMYYMHTMHELQKIGEFRFIKINIEVPDKYKDMKFNIQ